jgi:hypothetical protein
MGTGDFSASTLPVVQVMMADIFSAGGASDIEINKPIESAKCLLERQRVNILDIMEGNPDQKCQDVKVVWLKDCGDTVATSGAVPTDPDCVIGAGNELDSDSLTLTPNMYISAKISVLDGECADQFSFNQKVARLLLKAKNDIETRINNEFIIPFLTANAQVNQFTGTFGTIVGTTTEFPAAQFTANLLGHWQLTSVMNQIKQFFILNGTNFVESRYNSDFERAENCCDPTIDKYRAFDMCFDPFNIDITTGRASSFIIDPTMYAFWGRNEYTAAPFSHQDSDNTVTFKEPSQTLQYWDNGTLKPVMYDIRYQRECVVVPGNPRVQFRHNWEIIFEGGLALAPTGCTGQTNILEMVAT